MTITMLPNINTLFVVDNIRGDRLETARYSYVCVFRKQRLAQSGTPVPDIHITNNVHDVSIECETTFSRLLLERSKTRTANAVRSLTNY